MASNNSFLITNANLNPSYLNSESRNRTSKLINSQLPLQDATVGNGNNNFRYQMISSGNSDVHRNANSNAAENSASSHPHQQHQKIVYINNSSKNAVAANSGNGSNRFPLDAMNKIDTTASLLNFRVKSAQNLAKQRSTGN